MLDLIKALATLRLVVTVIIVIAALALLAVWTLSHGAPGAG